VKVVLWTIPVPTPATVITYDPEGVEGEVTIVKVGEIVGVTVQVGAPPQPAVPPLKLGVAPLGSGLTESATGCVVPVSSVTVIVLDPEVP